MTNSAIRLNRSAAAAAALVLGLAAPAWAQTSNSMGPEGSTQSGVKTPSSGGNEVSPRKGPLPGKSSTSVSPARTPKSVNEAGDARPLDKTQRSTAPAGSAMAPNPKTPMSVNEAGDARPLQDKNNQGSTTGSTGSGSSGSMHKNKKSY